MYRLVCCDINKRRRAFGRTVDHCDGSGSMILDKRKKIESGWDSGKRRMIKKKERKSFGKLDDCY